ncbi:MAG: serine protease [Candidatus Paceibacterota bacterium]|jgi:S1-C subfamily serine protease
MQIKQPVYFLLVILAGGFGGFLVQKFLPSFYSAPESSPNYFVTKEEKYYIQENDALKEAVQKVRSSVVGIKTVAADKKVIAGSGLILTSDGLAVTLAELVPASGKTSFFIDSQLVNGQILKRDLKQNLALIKIEKSGLSTGGFFMLDQLKIGERVFLVGQIFDAKTFVPNFLTNEGVAKSFDSEFTVQTSIRETDAVSGAPVFDIKGSVLGLSYIYGSNGSVAVLPITKVKAFAGL